MLFRSWEKSDTLHFDIPVNDSLMLLHISTEVRYSDQYPYKDFWVEIRKNFKGESVFEVDTLQFILADSIGRRSEQGWSCLYQIKHRMNPVFVRDTGMYAIKINHLMKDDSLIGIHDIGIKIDK